MANELTENIIKFGDKITYIPSTQNYGRAEFVICPVFKRGNIRELYIYPRQQETRNYYKLVIPVSGYRVIFISARVGNEPRVWQTFWCEDHRCHSLELYVPNEGNSFKVEANFGNTITLNWL